MRDISLLKEVGFSKQFLEKLVEFDKAIPNIYFNLPFEQEEDSFNDIDGSEGFIINSVNDNYHTNIIVIQDTTGKNPDI